MKHINNTDDIRAALENVQAILLLAGPSGAGKTTVAESLSVGETQSPYLKEYASCRVARTDSASLARKTFSEEILIVEFATNKIVQKSDIDQIKTYIKVLSQLRPVLGAHTISLSPKQAIFRYLSRMKPGQFFHLGKLKTLCLYMIDANVTSGLENWNSIIADLAIKNEPIELGQQDCKMPNEDKPVRSI